MAYWQIVDGAKLDASAYSSTALMMADLFMRQLLDKNLNLVNRYQSDNRQVDALPWYAYKSAMDMDAFRAKVLAAMSAQDVNKAELARRSGVSYHALDKFLKGTSSSTSADRAAAIAQALGIPYTGEGEYEELRRLFFGLPEEQRGFVLEQLRALTAQKS